METLLLSLADFAPYQELPENMRLERMMPYMREAQRRLRPVLGEALYAEVLRQHKAETLSTDYQELLGRIKPVLACATLTQFWPFSQTTLTNAGLRQKSSQYSDPVDQKTLAAQASIFDGWALSYEVELRAWLTANRNPFAAFLPVLACGDVHAPQRSASVVVQAIGRPGRQGPNRGSYPTTSAIPPPVVVVPPVVVPPAQPAAPAAPTINVAANSLIVPRVAGFPDLTQYEVLVTQPTA